MRIVVINHITLDGVMQSPGRPDEDTRGGFTHGGWAGAAAADDAITGAIGERMMKPGGGMLLGRRSYDDMLSAWNERGGPFKDGLNNAQKFVVSGDPATELEWPNSTLLTGDIPGELGGMKESGEGDLVIMGSGQLIRSLPAGLIDEYLLMIHPLVLGSGQRLFGDADEAAGFELMATTATATGVIIATYQPA